MANTNSSPFDASSADEMGAKAVNKRYEGLVKVRTKAIKGKGAWYWTHLEPILIQNSDTGLSKAVKLKCSLCEAVFSASNPSRTASEHLKRGTCPNYNSCVKPISTSPSPSPSSSHFNRKRSPLPANFHSSYQANSLPQLTYSPAQNPVGNSGNSGLSTQHLVLSGGKEDLGPLALLENSVKKLKSPKASPGPALSKDRVDSALNSLSDWFYECCGSVSFSSLDHPKFRAFLSQVGLPPLSIRDFLGPRLDLKFDLAKTESEARVRDAMFFQLSCNGWKKSIQSSNKQEENLVKFTVNLPNRTSAFQKALFMNGSVPSKYAEEIMWESIRSACGSNVQRCVGIVSDKYKSKALRNLEIQNHWMVNLSCQLQGFISLMKDLFKELPLFKTTTDKCLKLAKFFNNECHVRSIFFKFQMQELDHAGLLRIPSPKFDKSKIISPVISMFEDIINCGHVLQLVVMDDSYKVSTMEDPLAREVAEMIRNVGFWNELDAVLSLVKIIKLMAQEIETERPLIGQCLPLWEELRSKVKEWCAKFSIDKNPVEKILEKRFKKSYHPAMSAAFILDPFYLMKDSSGKYLPPFKCLTQEQEKDVDKLVTRLVTREEAHVALMELMKWRSEGLDPLYAQAVQFKERDPISGKMKIANPQSSRLVWETCLSEFKSLGKVAVRLIFLHATSCGLKCNWSFLRWVFVNGNSRVGLEKAQKLVFIAAHTRLGRRDFLNEEEKDAEIFATGSGEDDILNEVFADASSA